MKTEKNKEQDYCAIFKTYSAEEMQDLGRAFATAVSPEYDGLYRSHIVVSANSNGQFDTGKTTFFKGMVSGLTDDETAEDIVYSPTRIINDDLVIDHYDSEIDSNYDPYSGSDPDYHIVCIEHDDDMNEADYRLDFNILEDGAHAITITCAEELADDDGFQEFLNDAQQCLAL